MITVGTLRPVKILIFLNVKPGRLRDSSFEQIN